MADPRPFRAIRLLVAAIPLAVLFGAPLEAGERPGPRVTRFDIATRGDLLLGHLVGPTMQGEVADWSKATLGELPSKVGDWVARSLDANTLAGIITGTFPVEGQPALGPVDRLVADCAAVLGVEKPSIHLRDSPFARAYSVRSGDRPHLILTSRLLDLFEGRPEELRFVVGRELGHLLCGHSEMRAKGHAVLSVLQAVDTAVIPDGAQAVLPTLALGRLFTWCREAEVSADRAGLICCGEPAAAFRAIMRLQHGLRADSRWIDPASPDFDPGPVLRELREWQYQPLLRFILDLKRQPLDCPYYQERLAALKAWADTGAYRRILERPDHPGRGQLIEIVRIVAYELAPEGQVVDPYVIALDGDRQVLRTVHVPGVREAEWSGFRGGDRGVDQPRAFRDGQPLFFEIWDADYGPDSFIGGFVIYPDGRDAGEDGADGRSAEYTAAILWDWKQAGSISRPGHARVRVRFGRREGPGGVMAGRPGGE